MAGQNSPIIRKFALKGALLILLFYALLYSVHLAAYRSVQSPAASLHESVFEYFSSWLQACMGQAARYRAKTFLPPVKNLDVRQAKSSCSVACALEEERGWCRCLLPRAEDANSTRGYSPPLFPFNILPGRVETSCQDYSGYALERCRNDVLTRTNLFIALTVIFSLVLFCVILISILGCIRRVKARRRVSPVLSIKKPRGHIRPLLPDSRMRGSRRRGGSHQRESTSPHHLNEDEAVEAEEQGIANQDIPVTLDGVTDGWIQWIRQRANMNIPRSASPRPPPPPTHPRPNRPVPAEGSAPRIPSLKLPKPAMSTFRKVGGLGHGVTKPSSQRMKGSERRKGKETRRVRWDGAV